MVVDRRSGQHQNFGFDTELDNAIYQAHIADFPFDVMRAPRSGNYSSRRSKPNHYFSS